MAPHDSSLAAGAPHFRLSHQTGCAPLHARPLCRPGAGLPLGALWRHRGRCAGSGRRHGGGGGRGGRRGASRHAPLCRGPPRPAAAAACGRNGCGSSPAAADHPQRPAGGAAAEHPLAAAAPGQRCAPSSMPWLRGAHVVQRWQRALAVRRMRAQESRSGSQRLACLPALVRWTAPAAQSLLVPAAGSKRYRQDEYVSLPLEEGAGGSAAACAEARWRGAPVHRRLVCCAPTITLGRSSTHMVSCPLSHCTLQMEALASGREGYRPQPLPPPPPL